MEDLTKQQSKALSEALDLYIERHYEGTQDCDDFDKTIKSAVDILGGIFSSRSSLSSTFDLDTEKAVSFDLLKTFLDKLEPTFSERLLNLINEKGRKPSEIYTKAGIARTHFAKIKNNSDYHPTKETALAFAVALHLSLSETNELLKSASYTLSHSNKLDVIVEFFIKNGVYNIDEINLQLYKRGCKTLTNWRNEK